MRYLDDRYRQDSKFAKIVDMLVGLCMQEENEMTSVCIRDASLLARIKIEQSKPMPIQFSPDLRSILLRTIEAQNEQ